jgi:tetratricopeptide (TPR) repeat protein
MGMNRLLYRYAALMGARTIGPTYRWLDRLRCRLRMKDTPLASPTHREAAWEYAQVSLLLGGVCLQAKRNHVPFNMELVHWSSGTPQRLDTFDQLNECFQAAVDNLQQNRLPGQLQKQGLYAIWANALLDFVPDTDPAETRASSPAPNKDKRYARMALEEAHLAIELDPLSAYEHCTLGRVYNDLNELEQASSEYENAWLCRPEEPSYLLECGNIRLKLARNCRDATERDAILKSAIGLIDKAIVVYGSGQERQIARAHDTLGQIHIERNAWEQAASQFNITASLEYASLTSKLYLVWCRLHCKQYNESVVLYKQICDAIRTKG